MILAAGRGNRLRPLTDHIPKPLVPVGGKPLIEYHLERLAAAGVRDLIVNLGYRGEQIRQALGNGARWQVNIEYSDEGDPPLETGGGIKAALPQLGVAPFLLVNADVFTDFDFVRLLRLALPADQLAHLVMVPNPVENPAGDFVLQEGRLLSQGQPRLTYAGIAVIRPALVQSVEERRFPLAPLLRQAMDTGRVTGECHEGLWNDVGTPVRLAELEARLGRSQ